MNNILNNGVHSLPEVVNAQTGPFDFPEILKFIKGHSTVRLERLEAGIRFDKSNMSEVLTLVQNVNNRYGVNGKAPLFIQGIFIKFRPNE